MNFPKREADLPQFNKRNNSFFAPTNGPPPPTYGHLQRGRRPFLPPRSSHRGGYGPRPHGHTTGLPSRKRKRISPKKGGSRVFVQPKRRKVDTELPHVLSSADVPKFLSIYRGGNWRLNPEVADSRNRRYSINGFGVSGGKVGNKDPRLTPTYYQDKAERSLFVPQCAKIANFEEFQYEMEYGSYPFVLVKGDIDSFVAVHEHSICTVFDFQMQEKKAPFCQVLVNSMTDLASLSEKKNDNSNYSEDRSCYFLSKELREIGYSDNEIIMEIERLIYSPMMVQLMQKKVPVKQRPVVSAPRMRVNNILERRKASLGGQSGVIWNSPEDVSLQSKSVEMEELDEEDEDDELLRQMRKLRKKKEKVKMKKMIQIKSPIMRSPVIKDSGFPMGLVMRPPIEDESDKLQEKLDEKISHPIITGVFFKGELYDIPKSKVVNFQPLKKKEVCQPFLENRCTLKDCPLIHVAPGFFSEEVVRKEKPVPILVVPEKRDEEKKDMENDASEKPTIELKDVTPIKKDSKTKEKKAPFDELIIQLSPKAIASGEGMILQVKDDEKIEEKKPFPIGVSEVDKPVLEKKIEEVDVNLEVDEYKEKIINYVEVEMRKKVVSFAKKDAQRDLINTTISRYINNMESDTQEEENRLKMEAKERARSLEQKRLELERELKERAEFSKLERERAELAKQMMQVQSQGQMRARNLLLNQSKIQPIKRSKKRKRNKQLDDEIDFLNEVDNVAVGELPKKIVKTSFNQGPLERFKEKKMKGVSLPEGYKIIDPPEEIPENGIIHYDDKSHPVLEIYPLRPSNKSLNLLRAGYERVLKGKRQFLVDGFGYYIDETEEEDNEEDNQKANDEHEIDVDLNDADLSDTEPDDEELVTIIRRSVKDEQIARGEIQAEVEEKNEVMITSAESVLKEQMRQKRLLDELEERRKVKENMEIGWCSSFVGVSKEDAEKINLAKKQVKFEYNFAKKRRSKSKQTTQQLKVQTPSKFSPQKRLSLSTARRVRKKNGNGGTHSSANDSPENFSTLDDGLNGNSMLESREKRLKFLRSPIHEWGLFALDKIKKDDFVVEYIGEIIRTMLSDVREDRYNSMGIGCSYFFRLDEEFVIDATLKGNIARFINHCCDANCSAKIIYINPENEGEQPQPRVAIYALRDIEVGEEVTYDYKFEIEDEKIPCSCGAKNCRGTLN